MSEREPDEDISADEDAPDEGTADTAGDEQSERADK
jgi:hypothetical protein